MHSIREPWLWQLNIRIPREVTAAEFSFDIYTLAVCVSKLKMNFWQIESLCTTCLMWFKLEPRPSNSRQSDIFLYTFIQKKIRRCAKISTHPYTTIYSSILRTSQTFECVICVCCWAHVYTFIDSSFACILTWHASVKSHALVCTYMCIGTYIHVYRYVHTCVSQ